MEDQTENSARRAPFIVFEGIDGSGKSTQAKRLAERLEAEGKEVHLTFEPTNYRVGSILRRVLRGEEAADEHTIAALFLADRLDHIHNAEYGMLGMLERGVTVICDRYYYSSYAYHSQHMDMDWVIQANSLAAEALRPDVVFFMDTPAQVAMERIRGARAQTEHYEQLETLEAVRQNYLQAIAREGKLDHVLRLDAARPMAEISAEIYERVSALGAGD